MKSKGQKKNNINIVTLGCSKNLVDSEVLFSQLKGNGRNVSHDSARDDSEIVVINTCGFIDGAKEESIETILRFADAKKRGIVEKVYVTGCLSHRFSTELAPEIPEVDAWFGTNELPRLLKTLRADYKHELVGERLISTPTHYAYLKIAEGCDRPCSFCAIPLMRGGHISKPKEDIIMEAQSLAKRGTKELILIAQDLTYYGLDLYKNRELADLLEKLTELDGIEWIRLQYAYPAGFPKEILQVMRESPKVCKYLDMPLQSGSSKVLRAMRRGISREKTEELINEIREKVPGIALRTTLIVGHPGEDEAAFAETYEFVKKMRFDRLGVFQYSHEENTHAHTLSDDVPENEKQLRADEIMELQQGISWELNQQKVGQKLKVLFDKVEGGFFVGRTEHDSPEVDNEVLLPANEYVRLGDFSEVEIVKAEEFDLTARLPIALVS